MTEHNKSSSWGVLLPALLFLCAIYIIGSGVRGCSRDRELEQLKTEREVYDSNLNVLYGQLDSLKSVLSAAQQRSASSDKTKSGKFTATQLPNHSATPAVLFGAEISDKGTHFEVQIGAFQFFDLHKYRPGFDKGFHEERDSDELDKYTIAKFRNYADADAFKRDVIRLGIDDAWIVAKKDGKRVDIQAVLKK